VGNRGIQVHRIQSRTNTEWPQSTEHCEVNWRAVRLYRSMGTVG
jgi:hypothetical protein